MAEALRPSQLEGIFGQRHLLAEGKPLQTILQSGKLVSLILWGPPGTGKTTLARIIAGQWKADFIPFSAVSSGLADLRKVIEHAEQNGRLQLRTVLFIDEIHRWSKSQQDALLPHVENGTLVLIGATTENPSFEVNAALLSRCTVFRLHELTSDDMLDLAKHALESAEGLHGSLKLAPDALQALVDSSVGDARSLLNTLELIAASHPSGTVSRLAMSELLSHKPLRYDKKGEEHYNVISAFIKSLRGSDPNAGLYYLARLIEAGEDPKFIARRMVIFASEDVGNAEPQALLIAVAAFHAVERIGLPEARINLAQAVTFLATAPKSNASYRGINAAQAEVKKSGALAVPLHLRNAPTALMKDEGYGDGYQYAHNQPDQQVSHAHLPKEIEGSVFYEE